MTDYQIVPTIMYDLATVGEAYVELRAHDVPLPEARSFERCIAGSAAYIAMYHSMLGGKAVCIASVGADAMGTFIQNELRKYKIVTTGLQFSREFPTSVLFAARSTRMLQTTYYRLADWQLHNTKDHVTLAQSSRIVHGSGFSLWKHPARHSVFEILRLTKKFKSITVLQPFYEPALWRDRNEALATIKKTLQFADITTPTIDDAEHLFGKSTREDYIKKFHDLGVKTVILSMGKHGCLVSDGVVTNHVEAAEAQIVDPGGVHDSWHAGLYYAMNNGKGLLSATLFANAVAAYVLQMPGTLIELPSAQTISEQMLRKSFDEL
jgi:sugar/nucleoside kinase (ribokinase family)